MTDSMTAPDIQARLVEGGSQDLSVAVLAEVYPGLPFIFADVSESVDAALALAERLGWGNAYCLDAACQTTHKAQPTAHIWSDNGRHTGHARTMSAAICIAILKAKALQDGRDG